jgi:cellulose synthase operon protein C
MPQMFRNFHSVLRIEPTVLLVAFLMFQPATFQPAVGQDNPGQDDKVEEETPRESSPAASRLYQAAANAQNNGAFTFAAGEWEKLIKDHPKDPVTEKARYYLGICRLQQQDMVGAESAFVDLVAKYPQFAMMEETLLNLGWCQYTLGQGEEEVDPKQTAEARMKAEQFQLAKLKAAAATFEKLLGKYPKGERAHEAYYFRGEALYAVGANEKAVESYQKLITDFPKSKLVPDATYAIGVAQQESGNLEEALAIYNGFIQNYETHASVTEVRLRKGEVLLASGKPGDAEPFFEAASQVRNFELADYALFRLAFSVSEQRDYPRAASLYATLGQRFPDSAYVPQASMSVGRCWFRAGKWEQAEKSLSAHANDKDDPFFVEANHWMARILLTQNEPEAALRIASAAVSATGDANVNYLDHLMLDVADALYAMPDRQEEALAKLIALADRLPRSPQAPQALYNATFLALELGKLEQVDQLAARFATDYGDDGLAPDVAIVQAESLSQRQKHAEAEVAFQKVIAANTKHPEVAAWRLRLAFTMFLQEKHKETAEFLAANLQSVKGDQAAEAQFLLGLCHFNEKDYALAQKSFSAAVAAAPNWYRKHEADLYVARCYFDSGDKVKAIPTLREFLTTSPSPRLASQAHHWLGEALYSTGEYRDAAESYKQVGVLDAKSRYLPFSRYGAAWSYLKGGQQKEAVEAFSNMLAGGESSPRYDDALLGRGIARRQSGDPEAAVTDFDAFLKRNPEGGQSSDARYERSLALVSLKRWKEVIATLTKLTKDQPNYPNIDKAIYELAWAHRNEKDEENAMLRFNELAAKHADSPLAAEANFHLAEKQYAAKEYRKAIDLYTGAKSEIADRDEIREKAAYKIGWCWFQLQDYKQAMRLFQEQVATFPEGGLHGDGLFMQGECFFKLEDYKQALPVYLEVMQLPLSSDSVEGLALLHGGQAAIQLEKWNDSVTLLSEIFARQPKSPYIPEAHLERGWARQNLGQLEEAFDDYAVTAETNSVLGARARFMMGEARFQQKAYSDAIEEFQRVMFRYGGTKSAASVQQWQARAAMEAGRSAELLISASKNNRERRKYINEAKTFYEYILNNHPKANGIKTAKGRLDQLKRL